jgi:hypothetical protein
MIHDSESVNQCWYFSGKNFSRRSYFFCYYCTNAWFLEETRKYNLIGSYCWFIVFCATTISYVIKARLIHRVLLL